MKKDCLSFIILAPNTSARAKFLYKTRELAQGILVQMVQSTGQDASRLLVVSDGENVLQAASALGLSTSLATATQIIQKPRETAGPALILTPHRGPISAKRVQRVMASAETNPNRTVSSAMRVPVNCNPAWLSSLPKECVDGNVATLQDFKAKLNIAISKETRRRLGLNGDKVHGSQWLPELYAPDAAIVFLPAHDPDRSAVHHVCDAFEEYDDMPLFYRLPFFRLHEDQEPDFDLDHLQVNTLFPLSSGGPGCP